MASALIISPLNFRASSMANFDLPLPVEPKTTTTGSITLKLRNHFARNICLKVNFKVATLEKTDPFENVAN